MLGWCIDQSIIRYPSVLTASEICRQLGVAKNTGTMLKRRLQIFAMQHKEHIRSLMFEELQARYGNRRKLPVKDLNNLNMDVTKSLKDKRIPQADVSILWTARPSSSYNKRRGKHHGGAAIFRADSLGGDQVGVMFQAITWKSTPGKGSPVIYDSISNQRAETLVPFITSTVPKASPFFTDAGYKFLKGMYKNHRMVNHTLPARRGKGKSSRRWQQCGVHNQAVESRFSVAKTYLRAYRYFKPKYSNLILAEYSLWSAIKYYGVAKLASHSSSIAGNVICSSAGGVVSEGKKLIYHMPRIPTYVLILRFFLTQRQTTQRS